MCNRTLLCFIGGLAALVPAFAQPAIREDGVLNASSYQADVARGSWFVVFGSNMGPAGLTLASGAPFPTQLAGTSVTFTPAAGGTAVTARLWYTSATQLAGLLPSSTPAGDFDVRVTFNGQAGAPRRVRVVERNFGFATVAQNGAGPAQATNANLNNGVSLVRFTSGTISFNNLEWQHRPAYPDETLILWGTGLGSDPQSDLDGGTSGDQTSAASVRVIVGGVEITPGYAGRSSGSPGLDQINFALPGNVTRGCNVSLQVRAGGRLSNIGSLAIADSGQAQCTHPALSESQLRRLDQGGTVSIGALNLSKINTRITLPGIGSFDSTSESATGTFARYGISQVGEANFSLLQAGGCFVFRRKGDLTTILTGTAPQSLDAGAQLTLNGPNASNRALPNQTDPATNQRLNVYLATLYSSGVGGFGGTGSPTLTQGQYTIAGPGGADIGTFTASINFPGTFTWTNESAIPAVIPRSQNLTLNWTGGGDGLVTAVGFAGSQVGGTQTNPIFDVAVFSCAAPASAGTLSVPSTVLQQLPAVSGDISTGAIGTLSVLAVPDASRGQGVFTAPLTAGGNVDFANFSYAVGTSKSVGYN
ncbi:MAG: hypothetical protein HYZ57_02870 [Acidobacteria bacterium]|nr:hypothetical protein [Acidobacteriota bacterium]